MAVSSSSDACLHIIDINVARYCFYAGAFFDYPLAQFPLCLRFPQQERRHPLRSSVLET